MKKRCAKDECYLSLEAGCALFRGPTAEGDEDFWRCHMCHEGPVAAVLVPQPLASLEVTLNNQESG